MARIVIQPQSTRLHKSLGSFGARLEEWAINPWRRLSLLTIGILFGFFIGSAITSVAGVLSQLDPVAALVVVIGTELSVRLRPHPPTGVLDQAVQMIRIGFLYGLFVEGFKMLG